VTDVVGQYEECVVAFLDILGFKEFVKESESSPETLKNLIQAMQAVNAIPAGEKKVSNAGGRQRMIDIRRRFFSDSLVFLLKKRSADIPQLFFLIRYIQDQLWAKGYCLRGSIVLGKMYWLQTDDNVTVGPGLIDAYKSESEVAIYPRIMVSDELDSYIKGNKIHAVPFGADGGVVGDYVRRDADGVLFLDLLNAGITRHKGEKLIHRNGEGFSVQYNKSQPSMHATMMNAIREIVKKNRDNEDLNVRQKYAWLETYCNLCDRKTTDN
jgi:hypothetical protein